MRWFIWLVVLVFSLAGFGALSVWLGQDANWDLQNYHFYNAYALVHGRLDIDVQPAQLQTYLNPIVELPFYWLATHVSPSATAFWMGVLHGVNFWLLFLVSTTLLKPFTQVRLRTLWSLLIAAAGFIAPINLAEHGATMNDNLVSSFFLVGLWLALRSIYSKRAHVLIVAAGSVLGAGLGLKQTLAPFVIGLLLALPFFSRSALAWKAIIKRWVLLGSGLVAGLLVTNGFWMYELWTRFGNPFFPFLNQVFRSPYFATFSVRFGTYAPTLYEFIFFPFTLLQKAKHAMMLVRDARFAMLAILVAIGITVIFVRYWRRRHLSAIERCIAGILVLAASSYLLWLTVFYYYRFLHPLELLAPLISFLLIAYLIQSPTTRVILHSLVLGAMVGWLYVPSIGRVDFANDYFDVQHTIEDSQPAVVLLTGSSPKSFLIPFLPAQYRYIQLESNLTVTTVNVADMVDNTFVNAFITPALKAYTGRMFVIFPADEQPTTLTLFGLQADTRACPKISTQVTRQRFLFCPVERREEP